MQQAAHAGRDLWSDSAVAGVKRCGLGILIQQLSPCRALRAFGHSPSEAGSILTRDGGYCGRSFYKPFVFLVRHSQTQLHTPRAVRAGTSHLCPPRPLPPPPHYHLSSPQPAAKVAGKPGSVGVVTRMPRTHCPAVTTLPSCSLTGHPRAQSCD